MKVILRDDVDHLGYGGDVVDVKRGYWRNYLRPRGLADSATDATLAVLGERMERRRAAQARNAGEAAELQGLLNRTVLTIPALSGPTGKLFGSITSLDISKALEAARKIRLDHRKVQLDEPIKAVGTYMVPIDVFTGVKAEIKTIVVEKAATEGEVAAAQAVEDAAVEAEANAASAAAARAAAPAPTPEPAADAETTEAPADADADA